MNNENENNFTDPWLLDYYETGSTRPQKDRGGIIAVLLMMIIVLASVASIFGIMNIQLFKALQNQQGGTVHLSPDVAAQTTLPRQELCDEHADIFECLGLDGQTVSRFDQRFFGLPQGFLITEVEDEMAAAQAGVRNGDVIVAVEDIPITSDKDLQNAVQQLERGQHVLIRIYRQQIEREFSLTVQLESEE